MKHCTYFMIRCCCYDREVDRCINIKLVLFSVFFFNTCNLRVMLSHIREVEVACNTVVVTALQQCVTVYGTEVRFTIFHFVSMTDNSVTIIM